MTTFQQFLEKFAKEQRQPERRQRRDEWIAAVGRLIEQIRAWLAESDPHQLLDVIPFEVEKWEPALGKYKIPSLKIGVGEEAVRVDPMGRDAVGVVKRLGENGLKAEGRVDITDGVRKYILYRTLEGGEERWYVLDERFEPAPLDRARLEAILQDLLS